MADDTSAPAPIAPAPRSAPAIPGPDARATDASDAGATDASDAGATDAREPDVRATVVRAARVDDLEAVVRLHVRSWRTGFQEFISAGLLPDPDPVERRAMWAAHLDKPGA